MKRPGTRLVAIAMVMGLVLAASACASSSGADSKLTPVTVQLAWTHSAQFAGFYAADQEGYYAAEGLAVTLVEGGPTVDRLAAVLDGTAQFGIAGAANLIDGRVAGSPVRGIASILRRDPFAFFSLADSGITRPEDFVGKTIQVRERGRPYLYAVCAQVGVRPDQFTEDNKSAFPALLSGQVDVATGFVTTEVLTAKRAGFDLNIIYPDDYGVHFVSDVIFGTDVFLAANHDLTVRFLRATLAGWRHAVENPVEASSLVGKYRPQFDAELESATMVASLPFINTGVDQLGWMKPEVWAGIERTFRDQGVLTGPLDVTQVYTLQFLEEIYR